MSEFPVPLDNLITYVKALHPDGGPLANVSDAFTVSTQMDEQADALIGYFVDQARRSGLSWSQIGGAMGVSKQAAQKRFVPTKAADFMSSTAKPFSRFTLRAVRALAAAGQLAATEGKPGISAAHLAVAQLTEPEGIAAKIIVAAGIADDQVFSAIGTGPAEPGPDASPEALLELSFDDDTKEALKGTLRWALRLGHNYIGTEHLLLGVLSLDGPVSEAFTGLGLTADRAEELLKAVFASHRPPKETG